LVLVSLCNNSASSELTTPDSLESNQLHVNNTTLALNIKLSKTTFNQFEEIKIDLEVKNIGAEDVEVTLLDHYKRIYIILIYNSDDELVWNNPHFGLPPLADPQYLYMPRNATYTETFKWDQREHTGGGCCEEPKGDQVPGGEYKIVSRITLDETVYENLTLESQKSLFIQEQILWIIVAVVFIIAVIMVILFYRHRKKGRIIPDPYNPQDINRYYHK